MIKDKTKCRQTERIRDGIKCRQNKRIKDRTECIQDEYETGTDADRMNKRRNHLKTDRNNKSRERMHKDRKNKSGELIGGDECWHKKYTMWSYRIIVKVTGNGDGIFYRSRMYLNHPVMVFFLPESDQTKNRHVVFLIYLQRCLSILTFHPWKISTAFTPICGRLIIFQPTPMSSRIIRSLSLFCPYFLVKGPAELPSWVQPVLPFISKLLHATYTEVNHSHSLRIPLVRS